MSIVIETPENGASGASPRAPSLARASRRRRASPALPTKFRNRPTPVRMAIRAAAERASESGMTRSVAALLQAILSCVSVADPFAPVFARKETLAKMADISEASVYRGLTVLAEAEWIVREETRPRLDDGTVCISEIAITDKCAMLVLKRPGHDLCR